MTDEELWHLIDLADAGRLFSNKDCQTQADLIHCFVPIGWLWMKDQAVTETVFAWVAMFAADRAHATGKTRSGKPTFMRYWLLSKGDVARLEVLVKTRRESQRRYAEQQHSQAQFFTFS